MGREYSGVNDAATGTIGILNGAPACTASIWARRNGGQTGNVGLIEYHDTPLSSFEMALEMDGSERVRFAVFTTVGFLAVTGTTVTSDGVWHHILGWYDGANLKVYLDGVEEDTVAHTGNLRSNNRPVHVGREPEGGATFVGTLAEPCIWDGAVSLNDIIALSRGVKTNHVLPADIVGYWPLFGLDSPEPDYSINGNALTLTGPPAPANHAPVTLFTPKWAASMPSDVLALAPVIGLPQYGQLIFNSADEENRPRYAQRIARGTEE